MIHKFTSAVILVLFLVVAASEARGATPCPPQGTGDEIYYCCNAQDGWPTDRIIPVYLNANITDICGGDSTCSSFSDLQWEIISGLEELYSTTGTKLQFSLASQPTYHAPDEYDPIHGAIHVFASPDDCSGALGTARADGDYEENGEWKGWGTIRVCVSNSGENIKWAASHRGDSYEAFHALFLHELGHVLGMAHSFECTPSPGTTGLMKLGAAAMPATNISVPYIEFVRDMYATRSNFGHSYWSTTGATWYTSANAPSQANSAISRYAATNSRSSSNLFIGWRHHDNRIGLSRFDGSSWTFLNFLPHQGWIHVGLASITNSAFMVAFQVHWERLLGYHDVKIRKTTNGGSSWQSPQLQSDPDTSTAAPGVASTYDPATQQYITIWRKQRTVQFISSADANIISYRLSGSSAPGKLAGLRASDTPSIACGPTSVVGTYNCLLAYVSIDDWGGPVTFHHCRVAASQLQCGSPFTHNYKSSGTPSVAYSGTSYPWSIALKQAGASVFTWRSVSVNPAQWIDQRSVSFSPQAVIPAMGSRNASGDRRYVYSMDD